MPKTINPLRNAAELPDNALIVIAELADWLRVPTKTIYNGGKGTHTLPCVFLDAEKKRHRRWRVGAVRAWLRQREVIAAPAAAALNAPGLIIPLKLKRKRQAASSVGSTTPEDVAWFNERLAHYQARYNKQNKRAQ